MAYTKTVWQDEPSSASPLNASNLNKIENGIYSNDSAIGDLATLVGIGGIKESGSNAFGRYVKYNDGTMEVWGRGVLTSVAFSTAHGSYFRNVSYDAAITLPAPFINQDFEPFVQLGDNGVVAVPNNILCILQTASYSPTTIRFYVLSSVSQTATVPYRFRAVGRWK